MGFFDDLKNKAAEIQGNLRDEVKRFSNKTYHEAVVASCAIIAFADGKVSLEEKQKMTHFMQMNEAMKVFNINDTIKIFNKYVEQMEFDVSLGRSEALSSVGKLAGKPNEARSIVRLACAIGASDGNFDADEKRAAKGICQVLNLDPSEFEL
jgi:tellurite resistance protein TerB